MGGGFHCGFDEDVGISTVWGDLMIVALGLRVVPPSLCRVVGLS